MPKAKHLWHLAWAPLAAATMFWGVLRAKGLDVTWWQLWMVAVAVGVVIVFATQVRPAEREKNPESAEPPQEPDRAFADVRRWEDRLSWGRDDAGRFHSAVQRPLVTVIAERLHLRHGVDLAADPKRAHALLPSDLARLVAAPVDAAPTAGELDRIIRRIEEI